MNLDTYKEYLTARGLSANYFNAMRIFLAYLGERQLTQEIITQFFNEKEYGVQSKNLFIKAGRNYEIFLGHAESEWQKIKLLKAETKIPNYLSENELGQAISYLITYHGGMITSVKAEALLKFLFYSGARKKEIVGLKRSDFNLSENIAKVFGKGKKERFVYYNPQTKKALMAYFKNEPEQTNAFNIAMHDLTHIAQALTKHMGKKITTHLWRHSSARHMIDKGIPLVTVSRILGHSSINSTILYINPNEETIRKQYEEKMK